MKVINLDCIMKSRGETYPPYHTFADLSIKISQNTKRFSPVRALNIPPIKKEDGLWYSQYELINNLDELIILLNQRYKNTAPKYSLSIHVEDENPARGYSTFHITNSGNWNTYWFAPRNYYIDEIKKRLIDISKIQEVAKNLMNACGVIYQETKSVIGAVGHFDDKWFLNKNLNKLELVSLGWANYFGPEYVNKYGKDFFMSAPGYKKQELPDGGILYLVSKDFITTDIKDAPTKEVVTNYFETHPLIEKINYEPIYLEDTILSKKMGVSGQFTPEKLKKSAENLAKDFENEFKIKMDFTPNSVKELDRIITEFFDPNSALAPVVAFDVGAYLGEVILRNIGGQWMPTEDPYDTKIVGISNIAEIYPMQRTLKRWEEGERASLFFYLEKIAQYKGETLIKKKSSWRR